MFIVKHLNPPKTLGKYKVSFCTHFQYLGSAYFSSSAQDHANQWEINSNRSHAQSNNIRNNKTYIVHFLKITKSIKSQPKCWWLNGYISKSCRCQAKACKGTKLIEVKENKSTKSPICRL